MNFIESLSDELRERSSLNEVSLLSSVERQNIATVTKIWRNVFGCISLMTSWATGRTLAEGATFVTVEPTAITPNLLFLSESANLYWTRMQATNSAAIAVGGVIASAVFHNVATGYAADVYSRERGTE